MSSNTALGWNNYFYSGTVTANSAETGLGPTNLSSFQCTPSSGWQTANGIVAYSSDGAALLKCTFPTAGTIVRGVGLFNTNLTQSAFAYAVAWRDTGSGPVAIEALNLTGPLQGYGQLVGVFSEDITADFVQITFEDASNPDGHINIGGAFCGPIWMPRYGLTFDTTFGRRQSFDKFTTRGQQLFKTPLGAQRTLGLAFDAVAQDEAWDELGEMLRILDLGGNLLAIPDVTSVDVYREAIFGDLETMSDVSFALRTIDARSWRGQITERL